MLHWIAGREFHSCLLLLSDSIDRYGNEDDGDGCNDGTCRQPKNENDVDNGGGDRIFVWQENPV